MENAMDTGCIQGMYWDCNVRIGFGGMIDISYLRIRRGSGDSGLQVLMTGVLVGYRVRTFLFNTQVKKQGEGVSLAIPNPKP